MGNWTVDSDPADVAESRQRPINVGSVKKEKDIVVYQSLHKKLMKLINQNPEIQKAFFTAVKILTSRFPEHKSTKDDYRIWTDGFPFVYVYPYEDYLCIDVKKERAYLEDPEGLAEQYEHLGYHFYSLWCSTEEECTKVANYILKNVTLKA